MSLNIWLHRFLILNLHNMHICLVHTWPYSYDLTCKVGHVYHHWQILDAMYFGPGMHATMDQRCILVLVARACNQISLTVVHSISFSSELAYSIRGVLGKAEAYATIITQPSLLTLHMSACMHIHTLSLTYM